MSVLTNILLITFITLVIIQGVMSWLMWMMFQGDVNRTLESDIKDVKDEMVKAGVFVKWNGCNYKAYVPDGKKPEIKTSTQKVRCPKCKHQIQVDTIKIGGPALKGSEKPPKGN